MYNVMCNDLLQSITAALQCDVSVPVVDEHDVYVRSWLEIPLDRKQDDVLDAHVFVYRDKLLLELVADGVYVFTHDVITGEELPVTVVDVANALRLPTWQAQALMKRSSTLAAVAGAENKRANAYAVINGDNRIQLCVKNEYASGFVPKHVQAVMHVAIMQWTKNKPLSCSVLVQNDADLGFLNVKKLTDLVQCVPRIVKFVDCQPTKLYVELDCAR